MNTQTNPAPVDVLAVMDRQEELALRTGSQEDIQNLCHARAAVAELIAERDRLANIVRCHEAQILRMTAERAELIEAAKLALSSSNKSIRESAAKALTGAGNDIAKVREEMRERDRTALARCGGAP